MNALEEAKEMVKLYIEAEKKILSGQSYKIGTRELTRADLTKVVENREKWQKTVNELENSNGKRPKIKRVLIRDL